MEINGARYVDQLKIFIVSVFTCIAVITPYDAKVSSISSQGTWESTLLVRDLDGYMSTVESYYDLLLGINCMSSQSQPVIPITLTWIEA